MSNRCQRVGFTLVEVLAAIALGSLTLAAAVALYLSVYQNWEISLRAATQESSTSAVRLLLQTGLDRASEVSNSTPFGLKVPGELPTGDPSFFFAAEGSLFALPELGLLDCYITIDPRTKGLVCLLQPYMLSEPSGKPALLTLPLFDPPQPNAEEPELHFWFYNARSDRWESIDRVRQFGSDLTYRGETLSLIEIRLPGEDSIWLRLPDQGPNPGSNQPAGSEENASPPPPIPELNPNVPILNP
ncbi:MAG: PilW family protein [Puniceicoccaceae bacterium]